MLSSNNHLRVAENQVIMQSVESEACLILNANIRDGALGVTDATNRDKNIRIEGGIWNFKKSQRIYHDNSICL